MNAPSSSRSWTTTPKGTTLTALRQAIEQHPERPFLDVAGDIYTYGEAGLAVNRYAHGLEALGVAHGDTVATMLDNNGDAVLLWFAINSLGAVQVPLNTALRGQFLEHPLRDSGTRLLILEHAYLELLDGIDAGLVNSISLIGRRTNSVEAGNSPRGKVIPLDEAYADDTSYPDVNIRPEDLTALWYTSGTTGPSKGCMVSHSMACNLARTGILGADLRPGDRYWTPLPLFHINAPVTTILATVLSGGSATIAPKFSLSQFWTSVERCGADVVSLLGSMVHLIAQMDDDPAMARMRGRIRSAFATPFPSEIAAIWRDRFGVERVGTPCYGQTEVGMITVMPRDGQQPPEASGYPAPYYDVMVVDDNDEEVPPGHVGEIVARPLAPHVMFEGYWRRPESTLAAVRNLWFHTGDLGKRDEDGWLYFVDRKKDYLRRRGENISSFEMESAILRHPDVVEVAVYAVPSDISEDDVKVSAVLRPGAGLTEEELGQWTIDEIPRFALPRYIEFRSDLPKNEVGRVLKRLLREDLSSRQCWDREAPDRHLSRG